MNFGWESGREDVPEPPRHFPGPIAATTLTIGSIFAVVFVMQFVVILLGIKPSIASLGIAEVVGIGAVARFATQRVPPPHRERIGLRGFDSSFIAMLIFLLPIVVLLSEVDNLLRIVAPPPQISEELQKLQDEFMGTGWLAGVETVVVAVGIAPILEEWFFRGVIQQGLVARLDRSRGVILTAGLYAVVHVGPAPSVSGSLPPFVASFLLGLVLGTLRLATGSVLAPILLSAGTAALGLILLESSSSFGIEGLSAPGTHTPMLILMPSIFSVLWALFALIAQARQAPRSIPLPTEGEEPPRS
jgi:membrane protease YdiL (CAAX protease family)